MLGKALAVVASVVISNVNVPDLLLFQHTHHVLVPKKQLRECTPARALQLLMDKDFPSPRLTWHSRNL